MRGKRVRMVLAMGLSAAVLLAGCSGKGGETKETSKDGEKSAAGDITIEFFNQKPEIKDYIDDLIKSYEEDHPGIKIKQTQVPDAGIALNSRLASGDVPDIVGCYPNEAEYRTMVENGYFLDITGDQVLAEVDDSFLENIKVDGKDYNVPLTLNGWGIYYNKTQFEELGLKVPETWEEFENVCDGIKAAGVTPFAMSMREGWTTGHIGESLMLSIAGVDEARSFFNGEDGDVKKSKYYDEFIHRLDFFQDNAQDGAISTEYSDATAIFARGQTLMMPQGIWTLPRFEQAGMKDEVGMFPMPNDEGKGIIQYGVDSAVSISAKTKYPEEAKEFVAYLASKEAAQYIAEREGSPSAIKGVTTDMPATEGVTGMLFEAGRSELWYHFEWEAGIDGRWGSEIASYFVTQDSDALAAALNDLFVK